MASGQMRCISSSFVKSRPGRSSKTLSVSNTFVVNGMARLS
jgi:hypothetical protein